MPADPPENRSKATDPTVLGAEATEQSLILCGEKLEASRRRIETALVRATRATRSRERLVDEEPSHERIEVERIPIGRTVHSVPPARQDGDTTVLCAVEEVVVVERRLFLKDKVHIRRVKTAEHHRETVTRREQEATATRAALEPKTSAGVSTPDNLPSNKDLVQ